MKVKISIHAFLVQVSKLMHNLDNLQYTPRYPLEEHPDIHWIWCNCKRSEIIEIMSNLPRIDKVEVFCLVDSFGEDGTLHRFYLDGFYKSVPSASVQGFLQDLLETVPDGEILLDVTLTEFKALRALTRVVHMVNVYMPEYKLPKYNKYQIHKKHIWLRLWDYMWPKIAGRTIPPYVAITKLLVKLANKLWELRNSRTIKRLAKLANKLLELDRSPVIKLGIKFEVKLDDLVKFLLSLFKVYV